MLHEVLKSVRATKRVKSLCYDQRSGLDQCLNALYSMEFKQKEIPRGERREFTRKEAYFKEELNDLVSRKCFVCTAIWQRRTRLLCSNFTDNNAYNVLSMCLDNCNEIVNMSF